MTSVHFAEVNLTVGKDQKEYRPLPVFSECGEHGRVVCCWRLSWRERLRILTSGLLWHEILTFNQPLQPQLLGVKKPDVGQRRYPAAEPVLGRALTVLGLASALLWIYLLLR